MQSHVRHFAMSDRDTVFLSRLRKVDVLVFKCLLNTCDRRSFVKCWTMIAGLSLKLAESTSVYYMTNNAKARIPLACIYHFCSRPISVSLLRFVACMVNESISFTFDSFFYMSLQQSFYLIGMNV